MPKKKVFDASQDPDVVRKAAVVMDFAFIWIELKKGVTPVYTLKFRSMDPREPAMDFMEFHFGKGRRSEQVLEGKTVYWMTYRGATVVELVRITLPFLKTNRYAGDAVMRLVELVETNKGKHLSKEAQAERKEIRAEVHAKNRARYKGGSPGA